MSDEHQEQRGKRGADGTHIRIPLQPGESEIRFPNCCVYCGQPPASAHRLRMRKQQQVGEDRGLFARRTFIESSARMSVPYCRDHFVAAWLDKWVLGGVALAAEIIGIRIVFYYAHGTFLVEGDIWPSLLWVIALVAGGVLALGVRWIVRAAIGLVFPAMRDVSPLLNSKRFIGGKSLLGVEAHISIAQLDLVLHNPQVAEAVRQLNAGGAGAAEGIEVWQEPDEAAAPSSVEDSTALSHPAAARRPIGAWVATVAGGLIIVGTVVFWLLSAGQMARQPGLADQAASFACVTTLVCIVPAVTVGGVLLAAGLSRVLRHRREGQR